MTVLRDSILKIAKGAVEGYVGGEGCPVAFDVSDEYLKDRKACFVCLKKEGELRGCIGTLVPDCGTLAEEIARNAISAATKDTRFLPIKKEELRSLKYSVDVLSPMERTEESELDPKKYGVMVKSGFRRGVLLPDLEGVDTVDDQLRIAKLKAGISDGMDTEIFRFTVERFE